MPYEIGRNAIVHPDVIDAFQIKKNELAESIKPANLLEKIFTNQLLHAAWDLERVRMNADSIDAEHALNTATNRATRNFKRALAELRLIQSARANRVHPAQPILFDRTALPKGARPIKVQE
ncbi:MAG: hypothetical protein FJW32_26845 [Acidobacteria bacterium]|nr:hypothetical protein [Acidobacteriota bacterium]